MQQLRSNNKFASMSRRYMSTQRIANRVVAACAGLLVATTIGGYAMYRSHVRASGLEAARQWARMSPLPATANSLYVETRGGPFTREFTVRFHAPLDDVEKWLNDSPGTSSLKPSVTGKMRVYSVEPGGGAMHAEVTVDDTSGIVMIHTCWS